MKKLLSYKMKKEIFLFFFSFHIIVFQLFLLTAFLLIFPLNVSVQNKEKNLRINLLFSGVARARGAQGVAFYNKSNKRNRK